MQDMKREQIILLSKALKSGNRDEMVKVLTDLKIELFTDDERDNIAFNFLIKYLISSFEVLPDKFKSLRVCNYALSNSYVNIKYLPKVYQTENTYKALLKKDIMTLLYFPKEYQTSELWLEFLALKPAYFNMVPEEIKTPDFICEYALRHPNTFINVVPKEFINKDFWNLCMNRNLKLEYMPKELWLEYAVKHPYYFENIPNNVKTPEFVRDFALRTSTAFIKYIPEEYRNGEFYLSLLNITPRYINLIPRSFLKNK